MKNNFYNTKTRVLLDFHIPEWDDSILTNFDAKKLVEKYEKSFIDCIIFYAKDHYGHCYYNTKIGHKHKNLGDRDFLGEFVSEAKKRGVLAGAYYSLNWQVNVKDYDFWAKDIEGNYIKHINEGVSRWTQICYNSKEYLKFCIDQLTEIISTYDIDVIWLDMLNYPFDRLSCFCNKCERAFKEKYGYDELPKKPKWDKIWRDFLEFRFNANYQFATKIRDAIKNIEPDLVAIFNYHAGPKDNWLEGQKPVMHSSYSDFCTHEIYPAMFGSMYPSIVPRYLKGLHKDKPYEILTFRFNQGWDYTIKPKSQFIWEIMSAAANGASVMTVDQPLHTGELDKEAYKLIAEGYRYLKSKKNLYKGIDIKFSCIYFSQKTRDFFARDSKEKYLMSFYGAIKMFIEEHFPVDILFDENIDLINFNEYKILVLANTAILNDIEIKKIEDFVKSGGILIASDETSLYDEDGFKLSNYKLKSLFGVNYQGNTRLSYNYFTTSSEYSKKIRKNYSILINGPASIFTVNNQDVKVSGDLKIPFYEASDSMFFSHNLHPPWKKVGSALVSNNYYKGKAFFIPLKIFKSYVSKYALPEHRIFIKNIIDSLDIKSPVRIYCPLNVDTIIKEDKNNYYIHFIGYNPTRQLTTFTGNKNFPEITPPLIMEEPLCYKAEIKMNKNISDYYIEGDSKVIREEKDLIEIEVKDIYESIKIKK
ncbi:MAG: hypothetical protein FJW63_03485 [Actinobacteria bacterium]|nr:hypothetical protein [Actinomycetota bacterium]